MTLNVKITVFFWNTLYNNFLPNHLTITLFYYFENLYKLERIIELVHS
jgi:hypothetical protein